MTLAEFQTNAKRTCKDRGSLESNLEHMVIGMCSEINEEWDALYTENAINYAEELIDQVWYIGNYCTFRNYELENIVLSTNEYDYPHIYYISQLTDYVKKFAIYGKPLDSALEIKAIGGAMKGIMSAFVDFEMNFEQSLQNNIDKLKARYPDKFTEELALNRNLEAELIELSK